MHRRANSIRKRAARAAAEEAGRCWWLWDPIQASPIEGTSSALFRRCRCCSVPLYVDRRCCARALHVSLYLGYTATGDAAFDARCSLPDDQLRLNPPKCSGAAIKVVSTYI
jgi:hypothetical protein